MEKRPTIMWAAAMHSFQYRLLVTVAATSLMAPGGMVAGYFAGRYMTLQHAAAQLDPFASRVLNEVEAAGAEGNRVLAQISASADSSCSEQEIGSLRKLIFQSEYVKEGGRIAAGRIACSAALGRLEQPIALPKPDFTRQEGVEVYADLPAYRIAGHPVITLRMGNAFIVYSPYKLADAGPAYTHFALTEAGNLNALTGQLPADLPPAQRSTVLTRDGDARVGLNLYATRCSSDVASCMTAFISVPDALRSNRSEFRGYIALGGLTGAFSALALSFFFQRNKSIEKQLRRAVRHDELEVVYQPVVELATRRIVGAEALARWKDEDGLVVSPEIFIPIAEERGFVGEITQLVVRHSLDDFRQTLKQHPGFRVNVNISAFDLQNPQFLRMLRRYIERAGVPAVCVGIEVTESSTARHTVAKETIEQLHARGHVVHIDDFGTGYSSLACLSDLAVDAIKIDRAFTRAIGTEAVTVAILPQILAMAGTLNLQVVAEGIETPEQAEYFAASGAPILAQGWLFGRPVPIEEFLRMLAANERQQAAERACREDESLALPAGIA